jgi:hypothetical protein
MHTFNVIINVIILVIAHHFNDSSITFVKFEEKKKKYQVVKSWEASASQKQ